MSRYVFLWYVTYPVVMAIHGRTLCSCMNNLLLGLTTAVLFTRMSGSNVVVDEIGECRSRSQSPPPSMWHAIFSFYFVSSSIVLSVSLVIAWNSLVGIVVIPKFWHFWSQEYLELKFKSIDSGMWIIVCFGT